MQSLTKGLMLDMIASGIRALSSRAEAKLHAVLLAVTVCVTPLITLTGCQTTTEGGAVGAQRQQLLLVSSAELEKIATQGYTKLRNESSQKGVLNTDAAMLRRVRAIAARLEPQTGVF